MQGGRQRRAAEADRVGRLGELEAGQGLDVGVPDLAGRLLDLIEVGVAEPGQGGMEPVLERPGVAPPTRERAADQQVDRDGLRGGQVEPSEQDRRIRPGRLAVDPAPAVERDGELDRRVAGELPIGVAMAAIADQERPVAVVPAQPRLADPAVDLGLDVDAEQGPSRLGSVVLDAESLDVLARRLGPAGRRGETVAHGDHVGDEDPDRSAPPGQLGHEQVGRAQVMLEWLP